MSLYGDLPPPKEGEGQGEGAVTGKFEYVPSSQPEETKVKEKQERQEKKPAGSLFKVQKTLLKPGALKRRGGTATAQQKATKVVKSSAARTASAASTTPATTPSIASAVASAAVVDAKLEEGGSEKSEGGRGQGEVTQSQVGGQKKLFSEYAKEELIDEEYDPRRPNDYDIVLQEREDERNQRRLEEALRRRREEERRMREERERELARAAAQQDEDATEKRKRAVSTSAEEVMKRRAAMSRRSGPPPSTQESALSSAAGSGEATPSQKSAKSIAQKMMAKMGWKEGHGLGKKEQGITAPIELRKTNRDRGVIVKPPSAPRVVVLRNMVAAGDVDHNLNREVEQECNDQFGKVESLLIYEVPESLPVPEEEKVRIFVKFEEPDSAKKAIQGLNGRFFGGRQVRAGYFDEKRLDNFDLLPRADDMM
uniref:Splicing factor 45 n=1 Tax=Palpitomonas bilix TaxID=652834 RepID=A0A7S3DGF6_9EUKA|mmetsp:Transcript_35775/g.93255  ORF Transcript_35775/g.93255 Transcript_35775/m.93255 type:complete len:425 (+) Transcript_35775:234-1508(+)